MMKLIYGLDFSPLVPFDTREQVFFNDHRMQEQEEKFEIIRLKELFDNLENDECYDLNLKLIEAKELRLKVRKEIDESFDKEQKS